MKKFDDKSIERLAKWQVLECQKRDIFPREFHDRLIVWSHITGGPFEESRIIGGLASLEVFLGQEDNGIPQQSDEVVKDIERISNEKILKKWNTKQPGDIMVVVINEQNNTTSIFRMRMKDKQ